MQGVHALEQVAHLELRTVIPPELAAAPHQRRAARRHQHPDRRAGAGALSRAACRASRAAISTRSRDGEAHSPSRSCGGSRNRSTSIAWARPRRVSPACTTFSRSVTPIPDEQSTDVLVDEVALGEDGRSDSDSRHRFALHLEDGAPDGRRARRSRPRRPHGERRRPDAAVRRPDARPPDGARVRSVPRDRSSTSAEQKHGRLTAATCLRRSG